MFTSMDLDDEPLGLTLARCYRLARERARATHNSHEQNKMMGTDPANARKDESLDGCITTQPVIQSS